MIAGAPQLERLCPGARWSEGSIWMREATVSCGATFPTIANGSVCAVVAPGQSDGFRLDQQGWIYTNSLDSVQIYHPDARLLGDIHVPEKIGNLTFGGYARDQLYVAASIYRIRLATRAIQQP